MVFPAFLSSSPLQQAAVTTPADMPWLAPLAGWLRRHGALRADTLRNAPARPASARPAATRLAATGHAGSRPAFTRPALAPHAVQPPAPAAVRTASTAAASSPTATLRVLRVADGASRHCAGRMVISGRMADVCAELDRLAARDAQRHPAGIALGGPTRTLN